MSGQMEIELGGLRVTGKNIEYGADKGEIVVPTEGIAVANEQAPDQGLELKYQSEEVSGQSEVLKGRPEQNGGVKVQTDEKRDQVDPNNAIDVNDEVTAVKDKLVKVKPQSEEENSFTPDCEGPSEQDKDTRTLVRNLEQSEKSNEDIRGNADLDANGVHDSMKVIMGREFLLETSRDNSVRVSSGNKILREGFETLMYLSRNVTLCGSADSENSAISSFHGSILDEHEVFKVKFSLLRQTDGRYFDLRISDVSQSIGSHRTLARFQQAELALSFLKVTSDGSFTVEHEEPPIKVCLDLPNKKWTDDLVGKDFGDNDRKEFSIMCYNVVPVDKFEKSLEKKDNQHSAVMRVYMKLMQGELDALHGIQKCFHPDKELFELREMFENSLSCSKDCDTIAISGDNVGYRVHGMVLTANSNVFEGMFSYGNSDVNLKKIYMPSFVTANALEVFLKYLYARNRKDLQLDPFVAMTAMRLAVIYEIPSLMEVCEESFLAMPSELFCLESLLHSFQIATHLERSAIQTKVAHIMLRKNIKLSTSQLYLEFIEKHPSIAAKMMEMIVEFKNSSLSSSYTEL